MATAGRRPADDLTRGATLEDRLFREGHAFDFFQAVRLLHALDPGRRPVGRGGPPEAEAVRFRAHASLSFPPGSIYALERGTPDRPVPTLTQSFLGLTGPSGVLPRHYTELLLRLRESKAAEKYALRDWLDLFNHRLTSLFYRAWEKYRFELAYERGEYALPEPDTHTRALRSLVGLGLPPLRDRLAVSAEGRPLARVDDLAVLYYGGLFAHRPRNAAGLEALLADYFQLPVRVQQFQGRWLALEPANQTRLGDGPGSNNRLGADALAGERVWDRQGQFRVRVGPLAYERFVEFLPDRAPIPARKASFLMAHLVRLYVGPDLEYDVQLVLLAAEVPGCRLDDGGGGVGPRLGWNTWLGSLPRATDAEDVVLDGVEVFRVGGEAGGEAHGTA